MGEHYCSFDDCTERAQRYGLCWGHAKQKQRGRELTPLEGTRTPKESMLEAGIEWLEAEGDEEYEQAETRFGHAVARWMRSRGWRPPTPARLQPGCCQVVQMELPLRARRGQVSTTRARMEA